jgi:hypothetical protein
MISIEEKKVFALNRNTTVIVKSRKEKDAEIYRTTVSLIHETANTKPLALRSLDDVKGYIAEVDLEDDQASLFNG